MTYGAVALALGGYLSPVILVIGALIVLINGFVIQRLARRFTGTGGIYTYAFHSLSERMGFQTGWMYLYYYVLFGAAYTIGAAYILNYVLHISPMLVTVGITTPAFIFLVLGVNLPQSTRSTLDSLKLS